MWVRDFENYFTSLKHSCFGAYGLVITPDEGGVLRNESVVVAFAVITPSMC